MKHQHASSSKSKSKECTFRPSLTAGKPPLEKGTPKDRGEYLYQRAMKSKLLSKNRFDKNPLEIDEEKSKGECTFKPQTKHNTDFSKLLDKTSTSLN